VGAQLIEEHDHWVLPIEGYKVAECADEVPSRDVCYRLAGAEEGWRLRIWSPFTFRDAAGLATIFDPADLRSTVASALAVIGRTIERAVAHESGRLDLTFSDGSALSVESMPEYEA
jgi:hypothetical protein